MTRPHYRDWQADLTQPLDWAALQSRLVDCIPAKTSVGKQNRFKPATYTAIHAELTAAASWSSAGNQPGDEGVRSWCWCHGPWRRGQTPEAIAESIVDELRDCWRWHLEVLAWIDASPPPGRDVAALARLVAGVVDLVVGLGIHDSWYGLIVPVVAWTLERHGFVVPDELVDEVGRLCSPAFTSWVEPTSKSRTDFADEVTLAILDREMTVRWPDAPEG